MPPAGDVAAIVAIVAGAAFVQRLTGFGFALLAVPALSFVLPPATAVVLASLVSLPNTAITAVQLRHDVDRSLVRAFVGWCLVGMPFGLVILTAIPVRPFRILLGVVVALATVVIATGWRPERPRRSLDAALGVSSGVLSTSTGTNGPPIVLGLTTRGLRPDAFRATISVIFVVSNVASLVLFAARGLVTGEALALTAVAVVAVPAAAWLGQRAARRLADHHFRRLVVTLLFATAASTIAAGLRG